MSIAPESVVKSITTFQDELTPLPETSGSSGVLSSVTSFLASITWQTWLIIILILALLGINIFIMLAKGTGLFAEIFRPIFAFFGIAAIDTTKQTVQTSATGTKAGIDVVAGTTTGALDAARSNLQSGGTGAIKPIDQSSGYQSSTTAKTDNVKLLSEDDQPQGPAGGSRYPGQQQEESLQRALNDAAKAYTVEPDSSDSAVQTGGKAGWCYVGSERGIRTCAQIGVNDSCLSGDIFPTQDVCMNPSLRA
jgi:hypothetical protein